MTTWQGQRASVLVVEDDDATRAGISQCLRRHGWTVVETSQAAAAIEVLEAGKRIDLVFSDIEMPGAIDGAGLARWLRQNHPAIPILLTSGRSAKVDPFAGADALIAKPYAPGYVADLIRGILNRRRTATPRGA